MVESDTKWSNKYSSDAGSVNLYDRGLLGIACKNASRWIAQAKAKIWLRLSYLCRIRLTAARKVPHLARAVGCCCTAGRVRSRASGFRGSVFGFWVSVFGARVSAFGFWVSVSVSVFQGTGVQVSARVQASARAPCPRPRGHP